MLELPTQILTEIYKTGNQPRVGIKIDTMSTYYSAHQKFTSAGTGGKTFDSEITNAPNINTSIHHLGGFSKKGNMSLSILNQENFSDIFADGGSFSDPEGINVTANLYYYDGTDIQESEGVVFFRGIISDFPEISQKRVKLDIENNLTTVENPVCGIIKEADYIGVETDAINTQIPFTVGDMYYIRNTGTSGIWNTRGTHGFVPMVKVNDHTYIISSHELTYVGRIWVYDQGRTRMMYVDPSCYTITNPDSNGNVVFTITPTAGVYELHLVDIIDDLVSVTQEGTGSQGTAWGSETNTTNSWSGFTQALQTSSGSVPGDFQTLTANVDDTTTFIPVDDGTAFADNDEILLYGSGNKPYEQMTISDINGNVLEVTRGAGNRAHNQGIQIMSHPYNKALPIQNNWWDYDSDGTDGGRLTYNNLMDFNPNTYLQHTVWSDYSENWNSGYDWHSGGGTGAKIKLTFADIQSPDGEGIVEDLGKRKIRMNVHTENSSALKTGVHCEGHYITSCAVTDRGSGYLAIPVVEVNAMAEDSGTGCTVEIDSLRVGSIMKTDTGSGSGYVDPPTIDIEAPTLSGTQATATCTVNGGAVYDITVVNHGSGYNQVPSVTFTPTNGGSGAEAFCKMDLNSASVTSSGFGYFEKPDASVTSRDVNDDNAGSGGGQLLIDGFTLYTHLTSEGNEVMGINQRLYNHPTELDFPTAKGDGYNVYFYNFLNSSLPNNSDKKMAKISGLWWEVPYIYQTAEQSFQMFASCLGLGYGTWINEDDEKAKFSDVGSMGGNSGHGVNTFVRASGYSFQVGDADKWVKVVDTNQITHHAIVRTVDIGTQTITVDRDWVGGIGNQSVAYMEDTTYLKHVDYRLHADSTGVSIASESQSSDGRYTTLTLSGGSRWRVGDWIKLDGTTVNYIELPYVTKIISLPAYNKVKIEGTWNNLQNGTIERLPLITNPSGCIEGMMRHTTGVVGGDFDHPTMNKASENLSTAILGFSLTEGITMMEFLNDFGQKLKTSITYSRFNKLKLNVHTASDPFPHSGTNNPALHDTFNFTTILNGGSFTSNPIVKDTFEVVKTGKLLTKVTVPYGKNMLLGTFNYQTEATNNSVHSEEIVEIIEHPYTYDETTAELFRDHLLDRRHKKFWEVSLNTFTNAMMFETGDFINVQHPLLTNLFSGHSTKKWLITEIKQNFMNFQISIKAREI